MYLRLIACCLLLMTEIPLLVSQEKQPTPAGDFQISGTVVDANSGDPLPHARVAIAPVVKRDDMTVTYAGADGRFLFNGLAAGKYSLSAQARGHLLQSFNQHDQFSSSIAVGPNLESMNLVFKIASESSISGTVIDEGGEPVRQASVHLYSTGLSAGMSGTRPRGQTITNDEGEYHFSHLQSGHYLVAVNTRPWYARFSPPSNGDSASALAPGEIAVETAKTPLDVAYPITFFGGATDAGSASIITLARGERANANITLQPVPAIHLRLGGAKDNSAGSYITLQQRVLDGPAITVMVENRNLGSAGTETAGIPPGHYIMKTNAAGRNVTEGASAQDVVLNGAGLERTDGSIYASVSATVVGDAAGLPKQLMVRLLNKKTQEPVGERCNDDGEAVFKQGILPGTYEISIFNNQGTYLKTLSAEGAKLFGRTIEIKAGATVKLKIAIGRGFGDVNGVALRDGKPVAGTMILLVPPDPAHNEVLFRRDQSDSDGSFTLANVVPGSYTLLAIENGWDLEWMNPAVLRSYMVHGSPVIVQPNAKNDVKLGVQ